MALSPKPKDVATTPEPSHGVVDIVSKPARRAEVDLQRLAPSKIIHHSEGYKWNVTFYHGVVGKDNTIEDFDAYINNPTQQYSRTLKQVIRVSTPIDPVQNADDKVFSIRGEGFIDDGTKPNAGDLIVADVGDGRRVIFTIEESEMLSHLKDASYRISYQARVELSPEIETALNSKVVEEYRYSEELLERIGNPLVKEETFGKLVSMADNVDFLKQLFLNKFYDNSTQSLSVPSQGLSTHDPQVTSYMRFLGLTELTEYNHPPFDFKLLSSLYSLLIKPREVMIPHLAKNFGVLTTNTFYGRRSSHNIAFSGYRYTVFSGDYEMHRTYKNYNTAATIAKPELETYTPVNSSNNIPLFLPVQLTPYVLSEGFYSGNPSSQIEVELMRYIRGENISIEIVDELFKELLNLPPIEFFYYTPLVITVMLYVGM